MIEVATIYPGDAINEQTWISIHFKQNNLWTYEYFDPFNLGLETQNAFYLNNPDRINEYIIIALFGFQL